MTIMTAVKCCAVVALLSTGACAGILRTANPPPPPDRTWPTTLAAAQERAGRGEFDAADSLLIRYRDRFSDSRGALEALFWQGVFKLDPSNRNASISAGVGALDSYLSDPRPHDHAMEALTLRRVASLLDAANRLMASAHDNLPSSARPATATDSKDQRPADPATDAEIKRLKDELAKANAELERIKRRLAQPPGKG